MMPPSSPDNLTPGDWREWMGKVKETLDNLDQKATESATNMKALDDKVQKIDNRLSKAEVKMGAIGGLAGAIVAAVITWAAKQFGI